MVSVSEMMPFPCGASSSSVAATPSTVTSPAGTSFTIRLRRRSTIARWLFSGNDTTAWSRSLVPTYSGAGSSAFAMASEVRSMWPSGHQSRSPSASIPTGWNGSGSPGRTPNRTLTGLPGRPVERSSVVRTIGAGADGH
jgi:hypothetical protein